MPYGFGLPADAELVLEPVGSNAPEIRERIAWTSGKVSGLEDADCPSPFAGGGAAAAAAVLSVVAGAASPDDPAGGLVPFDPDGGGDAGLGAVHPAGGA